MRENPYNLPTYICKWFLDMTRIKNRRTRLSCTSYYAISEYWISLGANSVKMLFNLDRLTVSEGQPLSRKKSKRSRHRAQPCEMTWYYLLGPEGPVQANYTHHSAVSLPSNYLSASEINGVCQDSFGHRQNCPLACTAMQISAVQIILVCFIALYCIACLKNVVVNSLVQ